MSRRGAVKLLSWPAAWRRAALISGQWLALAVLSWVLVITSIEVAVIAASIQ